LFLAFAYVAQTYYLGFSCEGASGSWCIVGAPSALGSTVAFDALRADEIDVYVDYSGTIWATIMRRDTAATNRDAVFGEVRQFLKERYGIEPVGGPRLVRERRDVVAALQQLTATIDGDRMRQMNLAVDQDRASPAAVAEAFLRDVREERLGR
jgi:glycine betaine/choline ABC-type transport system substrate-binding protein